MYELTAKISCDHQGCRTSCTRDMVQTDYHVADTVGAIEDDANERAVRDGWVYEPESGMWICPGCVKRLAEART